jgi:flavin-dependent dehydrogenase
MGNRGDPGVTADRGVAIVGGGPAGSALAIRLARAGHDVVLLERSPAPAWRACGVFASPAALARLRALGLDEPTLRPLTRSIRAMRVQTPAGTTFRLTYGDDGSLTHPAVGFDRPALDRVLLGAAEASGADVRRATPVTDIELGRSASNLSIRTGAGEETVTARVVVGADGIRSLVARTAGVVTPVRFGPRIGLTYHVADASPDTPRDARMVVLEGAYCGLAPVPAGRVNVGIVLASARWRRLLAEQGAGHVTGEVLRGISPAADDPGPWSVATQCDEIVGAAPLGHRVSRRAGNGWLLIGDAAGFLDPFTGEGLHRALLSAEVAASAIEAHLADGRPLTAYEQAMDRRFRAKDAATVVVQAFLARPWAFDYAARRLAARRDVRETMGLVIGDLLPASRAFDPRFLMAVLRP